MTAPTLPAARPRDVAATAPPAPTAPELGLRRYDLAAERSARLVLREYSTSFGWATRLLARWQRPHIANIYGLVRIADEIVDGPAQAAGVALDRRREMLDRLERDVHEALAGGYSANLIVHAFARTASQFGIGDDLIAPFFASMRADLTLTHCTEAEFASYVHGSAEVVGLMCLRVFLDRHRISAARRARLEAGAKRLGAAFQKINFLRDLGEDVRALGRCYFPNMPDGVLTDARKREITASIRADLRVAALAVRELPGSSRVAVAIALSLFAELTTRIERLPAAEVIDHRVRVPDAVKARIIARAILTGGRGGLGRGGRGGLGGRGGRGRLARRRSQRGTS